MKLLMVRCFYIVFLFDRYSDHVDDTAPDDRHQVEIYLTLNMRFFSFQQCEIS